MPACQTAYQEISSKNSVPAQSGVVEPLVFFILSPTYSVAAAQAGTGSGKDICCQPEAVMVTFTENALEAEVAIKACMQYGGESTVTDAGTSTHTVNVFPDISATAEPKSMLTSPLLEAVTLVIFTLT